MFIVTPGPRYDANDNVITETAPNGAVRLTSHDRVDTQVRWVHNLTVQGIHT
jgi:hypothetical protein